MNIIIPICGIGERFSEENYNLPKPLIKSLGKPIIYWTLENLKIDKNDKVFIVYRDEFKKFNFESLLINKFRKLNFQFIPIKNNTTGASETVYHALEKMTEDELLNLTIVIDSDNFYNDDIITEAKNKKTNLIFYHKDLDKNPIYSYIKIDSQSKVLDIKEKEKISDNICVGAYCFETANLLKNSIELISKEKKYEKEFYISSIYKFLIDKNISICSEEVLGFNCLGTPNQLKSFSSTFTINNKKCRFCFDLDNTLVTYPEIEGDYTSVKPINKTINFLNFLHSLGHTIIIYTARRMKTHLGNVGKVQADIAKITIDSLEKFNINYDEIYFGKPYADFYIDDLSLKPFDDLEKETGFYNIHPQTRNHNKIEVFQDFIIKYSKNIDGEKYYYQNIPESSKNLFPKLIDYGENFIKLEKINGIPLSFLNTNNSLNENILISLFDKINELHQSYNDENINIYLNYYKKFINRIENYDFSNYKNYEKNKNQILEFLKEYEFQNKGKIGIIHGDLVFTNILIDNKNNLKMIDMRGKVGNQLSICGDLFYDWSKIYQSIIGYDHILMDKEIDKNYIDKNKLIFEKYIILKFNQETLKDIKEITKSLLLSLIPIHNNEKCIKYYNLIENIS